MDKLYTPTEIAGTLRRREASCRKQACVDFSSSFEMRRLLIALGQTADSRAVKSRVHKLLAALHAFEKNLMQHVHKAELRRTRANLVYQLEALESAVSLVPHLFRRWERLSKSWLKPLSAPNQMAPIVQIHEHEVSKARM